jgi:hypothetical protein
MSDIEAGHASASVPCVSKFERLGPRETLQAAAAAAVAANGGRIPHLVGIPRNIAWISPLAHGVICLPGEVDVPFEVNP